MTHYCILLGDRAQLLCQDFGVVGLGDFRVSRGPDAVSGNMVILVFSVTAAITGEYSLYLQAGWIAGISSTLRCFESNK